jgi:hypothetical protein
MKFSYFFFIPAEVYAISRLRGNEEKIQDVVLTTPSKFITTNNR